MCDKCKSDPCTCEVVTIKNPDELIGAVVQISQTLQSMDKESGEFRETSVKATEELRGMIEDNKTQLTMVSDAVADLSEEKESQTAFFDGAVSDIQNKAVAQLWGYNGDQKVNHVDSAISRPSTKWDWRKSGFISSGDGYAVPEHIMQMNDFLVLWGAAKANKDYGIYSQDTYERAVKGSQTYELLIGELRRNRDLRKAMDTATSGEGSEWVPTLFSGQFIDDLRLSLNVAAQHARLAIPMRTGGFTVPAQGSRMRAFLVGESTSDSSTNIPAGTPGSRNVTFTAIKHAVTVYWSDELDEDSAVAMAPLVNAEVMQAIRDAEEDATINGDTSSTHQDSDVTASNDVRKSWQGLRNHSGGSSGVAAVDIGALTLTVLRSMRKAQGRFGANPADAYWLTGVSGLVQLLALTQVDTLDKFGPQFTARTGTIAVLDGSSVIVSEFVREDLTTAGIYDGTTTTDTIILRVHAPSFWYGDKGQPKAESDRDIRTQQSFTVASRRIDFQQVQSPSASEETVALGYSLTS